MQLFISLCNKIKSDFICFMYYVSMLKQLINLAYDECSIL